MDVVARGDAEIFDGRGVNLSYRVTDGDRPLAVKVHCRSRSSEVELQRILHVDAMLRGTLWYPPVTDIGFHGSEHPVLVVIRPFASGASSDDIQHHIVEVADVLGDLAAHDAGIEVAEDLIGDYASPWLSGWQRERRLAAPMLVGEWSGLAQAMDHHIVGLLASAARLTRLDGVVIYHGDLHGQNLIFNESRQATVIDWDETGFSRRPADAGKTLWLTCRRGRGDFVLHPPVVRHFLERMHARLHVPYASASDLAKLGAVWFLPRYSHVALLKQRDPDLVLWYLGWVSRFWSRFQHNLGLVAEVAAALDQGVR